ncbi:hypothetical protein [Dactylosporangium sp. NPDC050588]|uniref:hypothetical protein n=1 Tax=Dactylosporangium sp. NPDC050588 TaxID=3157211 RepID=UPI0033D3B94B
MADGAAVQLRPIVSWPRIVRPNTSYLLTVDVELAEPGAWPYAEEEYAVGCVFAGTLWCSTEPLGSTMLLLHRFGGTYGPVRFALHVGYNRPATPLVLTLLTGGGVPFHQLRLPVERAGSAAKPKRLPTNLPRLGADLGRWGKERYGT